MIQRCTELRPVPVLPPIAVCDLCRRDRVGGCLGPGHPAHLHRSSDRTARRHSPPLSPYAVGIVELDEGVRMMSNIVDCDVEALHVGMALEVVILKAADDVGLPFWRPAAG